ncbi:MAG: DUF2142 domain-containing protein [Salinibacterium sp.]|nr:DUF2142 domain-containing protein [Salinibacterium sp.]
MSTESAAPVREYAPARRFRWIFLAPVLALLALSAWAFASPVGASPDDDYHLASIWCANEARTDLCAPDPVNGEEWRLVLPGITTAPCFVADPTASAGCQEWSSERAPTVATAHGNWIGAYPPVFYAVMNVFASADIQTSAIIMRLFNVVLFVAFVTALAWLLPAHLRVPLIAGSMVTSVPLAGYLIASNNPGAWAVIGVGASWLAALGWFRSTGRRSWALGAITFLAVLLAAGARTDAAVYSMLGLGIASFLSFERTRTFGLKLLLPVGLVIMAALFFRTSGYAAVAVGGLTGGIEDSASRDPGLILAFNLISIPGLWTGVFGSWGLGWRMEVWPGFAMVEFATLVVFIGLASLGIRDMHPRKAIMTVALVATLYLLPLYVLTVGLSVVGENVSPRYIMPLVVVLAGLLLLRARSSAPFRPGRWHVIPAMVLLWGAYVIALYTNLRRYITGFDVEQLSLEAGAEWWWAGFPVGPTVTWLFGSVAFAALVVVLGIAWLRDGRRQEVSH